MQIKKVQLIPPSSYQESVADLFSKEVFYNTSNKSVYTNTNKSSPEKLISGIYLGKLAEFAVWNFLISVKKKASFPDVSILPADMKSYDADIISEGTNIHVKSCMSTSNTFPISWLFYPNDPVTITPQENDFCAFVICYPSKRFEGYFAKAVDMIVMYKDPKLEHLKKKVIYEEDLIKLT
jgi:hypothetical protein